MSLPHRLCAVLAAIILALPAGGRADERILDYQSRIRVHANGGLTVIETLRVRTEGKQIRRGIYREFPTRYEDRFGNRYQVQFAMESVHRNGALESWHSEDRSNGVRIYAGSADRLLPPGVHVYEFRYHTHRQLGFFAEHDELYWNVTGNGWAFPIDRVSALVAMPFDLPPGQVETSAFVGAYGSTETSAAAEFRDHRSVEFTASRPLRPGEGFTIAVSWPKGLVAEPSAWQKITWFGQDNGAAIALFSGLLLSLALYWMAWHRVGRDPQKGVIIPRFKPPDGLSPAACRYVLDMSFHRDALTAAIVSLAVKGFLRIDESDGSLLRARKYTLTRTESGTGRMSRGENLVRNVLLPGKASRIELDDGNHREFQRARSELHSALKSEYLGRLFHLNTVYLAPPLVITGICALIALAFPGGPLVWISWGVLALVLHLTFTVLLRAPTPGGRQVMDEIEGFRRYLGTAERDRLELMRSPQLTPDVFESFLPYAYALGVQNSWCERFAREMPEELRRDGAYRPGWYGGDFSGPKVLRHLGDDFGSSLSAAISSASSPPGSSSGSGGGGFSGGGGGGGGGGGW